MDAYENVRSLGFRDIASALGLDLSRFKQRRGKHGPELFGPCPIHKPKNNTTSFSYSDAGMWHCFSCNAHGRGSIDFVKELRACGFKDAVDFLTVITPLPTKKAAVRASSEATGAIGELQPLEKDSWRKFQVPCPWLEERIPDAAIREKYGVFCYSNPARRSAYSGMVMIPIRDVAGTLFGYLARNPIPQGEPKYAFPRGFPKTRFLFGAAELRQHLAGISSLPSSRYNHIFLVESPFCTLRFASLGLPCVAAYGWSVSDEQIDVLTTLCKGVVYLPDRNKSQECGDMVHKLAKVLWVRCPALPYGVDDPEKLDAAQILRL